MIWLIGNRGMLGSAVELSLKNVDEPVVVSDWEVDITDSTAIEDFLHKQCSSVRKLNWIINCAAYTAVDKSEDEPVAAARLNSVGPKNLAAVAVQKDATLLHVSTDYVFDGEKEAGYTEDDQRSALSIYGRTKWAGEAAVQYSGAAYYIVRTAWLFGERGPNFVATMLGLFQAGKALRVVNDQWGKPTYAGDLAEALVRFVQRDPPAPYGIYHFSNDGVTNWYEFAREIHMQAKSMKLCTDKSTITPVATSEYPTKAHRPHYSVLHTDKIKRTLDMNIRSHKQALHAYLTTLLKEGNEK